MRSKTLYSVALLIESGWAFGRGLLKGTARYARTKGNWSILYHPWESDHEMLSWLKQANCDGVIARITTSKLLGTLCRLKVPVVDVRREYRSPDIPVVGSEDRLIAQLAADHLLERGFHRFAFCGFAGINYSVRRRDFFTACLAKHHHQPIIYEGGTSHRDGMLQKESRAMFHERELGVWLSNLPKPIGLMACNDLRGRQALNACRTRRIAVPDDVAVIGVDNDEVLCELADPPLSSVIQATEQIGYEAAALLESMMEGQPPPKEDTLIEPIGVVTRRSTDVLAVEDRRVAAALRFIRENASEGISVEDVLNHLSADGSMNVSRSTLEHRFLETLGRSPKDEILRLRLERVKQLLVETDWTLAKIAEEVGIERAEYLSALFKRKFYQTPGEFRLQMKR